MGNSNSGGPRMVVNGITLEGPVPPTVNINTNINGGFGEMERAPSSPEVDLTLLLANPGLFGTLGLLLSGGLFTTAVVLVLAGVLPGVLIAGVVPVSLISGGLGVYLLSKRKKDSPPGTLTADQQSRLLEAARAAGGRLSVTETAQALGITFEEADKALSSLTKSGYVQADIESGSGVLVYIFREYEQRGQLPK
jgi:hypothetical protein